MTTPATQKAPTFSAAMAIVRRRRLYLWIVIAVYLPAMWTAQQFTKTFWDAMPVFWVWFAILLVVVTISALTRCPNCGNYFHMNGTTLLYLRRCVHCQLHITEEKPRTACVEAEEVEGEGANS